jgi:hypothetical protein
MASVISKKPFVGFAAGLIFGFLGMLLVQIDTTPGSPKGIVLWMFKILGYFLLFVAAGSFITAVYALWRDSRGRSRK